MKEGFKRHIWTDFEVKAGASCEVKMEPGGCSDCGEWFESEPVPVAEDRPVTTVLKYENHNQVDYGPLRVRRVAGRVVDAHNGAGIEGASIGLFTENGHRLISLFTSDRDGRYNCGALPRGRYRLVVKDSQRVLCVANVPVKVVGWPGFRIFGTRRIVVHLRGGGYDQCSYADFKDD